MKCAASSLLTTRTAEVRRVVTAHDANGKAIVKIDCIVPNNPPQREGHRSCVVWTSDGFPADVSGEGDRAAVAVGTTLKNCSVFRVIEYAPGVAPRLHRTETIDYAVVLSGEINMGLDDSEVHLKAGDVLVQRATIHNWVNRGTETVRHRLHPDWRRY